MKLTKIISILGWLLIISGLTLFLFEDKPKEEPRIESKTPIYYKHKLCLMEMLWYEGRGLSTLEKEALLDVVINRSNSKAYPKDVCDVINQPWQFSYKNKIKDKTRIILPAFQSINRILEQKAYIEIEEIVDNRFQSGNILPNKVLPENALWYHTHKVRPKWSRSKKIKQIVVDKGFKHRYYTAIN